MKTADHITVMLNEAVEQLKVTPKNWYVDCTFGAGGHTGLILEKGGNVIAFDFDQEAIDVGKAKFAKEIEAGKLILIRENFDKLTQTIKHLQEINSIDAISGVLFDFGTSTDQLMADDRGFSFSNEQADLDMRMDNRLGVKASDLLKVLNAKELARIFREFGGEEKANAIAKVIVRMREQNSQQLETVGGLVKAISMAGRHQRGRLHPATKVFQALRIVVNDEMSNIENALPQALELIKPGGRIVTIAFHEGEDRLAKYAFTDWEVQGQGIRITHKAQTPSEEEIAENSRSRSAKLRVFERNI